MEKTTRTIKTIRVYPDKCTGCLSCEIICSAYHAEPKYGVVNPKRSRIHVFRDEENDLFVPILAGSHTEAECLSRHTITIGAKEYAECSFCRSSCPSRSWFKEPDDQEVPLKCDACGEPPPENGPLCVEWCYHDALVYGPERQEEVEIKPEATEEEVEEL